MVVLRDLFDGDGVAPSLLADRLGMTRGAISKLADRLIAKELIERTASMEDRRQQTLSLTAAGRKLVPALSALADRNDAEFFGHLKTCRARGARKDAARHRAPARFKTVPTE